MGFRLIVGTPVSAVPKPWKVMRLPGVMVNSYELLKMDFSVVRGRGLRRLLEIDDDTELWIDSGGYQFLSKGEPPSTRLLYKLVKLYREVDADYYVALDVPPGPRDDASSRAAKISMTINNFIKMRDMLRDLVEEGRLVPVFHLATGEALSLQLRVYEPCATTAAVGGLIPYIMQRAGRYSRAKAITFLTLIRKLWSGRLHALGIASAATIPLLREIGVDSGDTQSWRHKAAYGKVVVPGLGERHISGQKVSFGPAVFKGNEEELFTKYLEEAAPQIGVTREGLREKFEQRALFNLWVLLRVSSSNHGYLGASRAFANLYKLVGILQSESPDQIEAMLNWMMNPSQEQRQIRRSTSIETVPSTTGGVAEAAADTST